MKVNPYAQKIIDLLEISGYEAYIVGGCVRDSLLGKEPNDWDITTNALPEQIMEVFQSYHTIPTGLKHGTVSVVLNHELFEITTFRVDGEYLDCRKPESVKFVSSIEEDLARRDLTINAMAYHPQKGLIDPFSGWDDLRNKMIRAVGNPGDRFNEDALRMLRTIRFARELNFLIDPQTLNAIKAKNSLIKKISVERIRDEFNKILLTEEPSLGVRYLFQTKLLQEFLPEVSSLYQFDQHNPHHHKDVFDHTMEVLDATTDKLVLRWAALLHDIGKPNSFTMDEGGVGHFYQHHIIGADIARNILLNLKFDNATIEKASLLVYNHMFRYDFSRDVSIKKFIARVGVENLNDLFELQIADIKGSNPPHDFSQIEDLRKRVNRILSEKQPVSVKDLAINGNDLIEIGFKEGKEIGDLLKNLLEKVLENPESNNKDILLEMAKHLSI